MSESLRHVRLEGRDEALDAFLETAIYRRNTRGISGARSLREFRGGCRPRGDGQVGESSFEGVAQFGDRGKVFGRDCGAEIPQISGKSLVEDGKQLM
jgi:hypothetical protein